jgi:hypothetical protein
LYLPSGKILSLNLRYPPAETTPAESADTATRELIKGGIQLMVEVPNDQAKENT